MAETFDDEARRRYIDRALELHHSGYNCAQSVVCALSDLTDLDEDTLFRVADGRIHGDVRRTLWRRCHPRPAHERRHGEPKDEGAHVREDEARRGGV